MAFSSNRPHPGSSFAPMLALLAVVLALVLYLRVVDSAIYGPSLLLTQNNAQLQSQTPWSTIWLHPLQAPGAEALVYRPMMVSLLRAQIAVWGSSPSSFHAMNLLLFAAGIVLLVALVSRLTAHAWARVTAVFLFVLHPLASQSVQSVAGQGGLLALDAMLGAGILLLAAQSGRLRLWVAAMGIGLLGFAAASAHELGLLLPLWLLLLAAAAPLRASREAIALHLPRRQRRKLSRAQVASASAMAIPGESTRISSSFNFGWIGLLGSCLVGCLAYLALRWVALDSRLWSTTPALNALFEQAGRTPLSSAPSVIVAGLLRLVWPAWPTLVYEFGPEGSIFLPVWAGWIGLILLLIAGMVLFCRQRLAGVAVLMLTATLACLGHWIPSEPLLSEQALLFAIVPLGLLLASGVEWLIDPSAAFPQRIRGRLAAGALIAIAVAMTWQTWNRGSNWRSETSLWQAEVARHPQSYSAHLELLRATMRAGESDEASRILAETRTLRGDAPDDELTFLEAVLLSSADDRAPLRELLQRELDSPQEPTEGTLARLAQQAYLFDQKDLATQLWEKELKLHPDSFSAQYELAEIERNAGNLKRAVQLAKGAVQQSNPHNRALAMERFGIVLTDAKYLADAKIAFNEAIKADPSVYQSYVYRARIFMGEQDYPMAEDAVERARRYARVRSYADLAQLTVAIYEAKGQPQLARDRAIYFADHYPSDVATNLYVARYLLANREYTLARKILDRTYPMAGPRTPDVLVAVGLLYLYGDHNLEAAIAKWKEARKLQPGHPEATRMLIDAENVYRQRQQKQQYSEEMQRLLERQTPAPAPVQAFPLGGIESPQAQDSGDASIFPMAPATP